MSETTKSDFKTELLNIWNAVKDLAKKAFNGFLSAKTFWTALAILVILFITSIVVLSIRLYDFSKLDDRSVSLRTSMDERLNVFAVDYANDSGEITVSGTNGDKVIAPGTSVEYTLRIRNTDKVALNYSFTTDVEFTSLDSLINVLPIEVRLLDPEDSYVIGSETQWVMLSGLRNAKCTGTLMPNETAEYVFQWQWPYESGNDEYDTFLGSAAAQNDISFDVFFDLHAEANTDASLNGGFLPSSQGKITVLIIIAILLAIAIALLLIYIINKRKAVIPEEPVTVEVPVEAFVEVEEVIPAPVIEPYIPKLTFSGKMAYINIDTLAQVFNSGDRITIGILKEKGLIPSDAKQIKILARASETLDKAFIIETQGISKNAEVAIRRAGGTVIIAAPDGDTRN